MKKKQTAVECLQEYLSISLGPDRMRLLFNEFEKAKQMEKEQIEIAFAKSYLIGCEEVSYNDANKASENYYNETYGGNNSEITMNNQSSTFPYVCASCNKEMVAGGFPKWFCLHTTCKNYLKPITK